MQSKTLEKNTNEVKADADQRKKIAELTKQLQGALTKLHDAVTGRRSG
jgi:glutamine synthetase type III